jgi:hypothetical protein
VPCSCSRVVEFGCLKYVSESFRKKCGCVCSCILAQTTAPGECKLCKVKGNTSDSGEWCSACGDVWYCGKYCRVGDQIRHNSEDCNDSVQVRFVLGLFSPPLPYAFSSRCFRRALSLSLHTHQRTGYFSIVRCLHKARFPEMARYVQAQLQDAIGQLDKHEPPEVIRLSPSLPLSLSLAPHAPHTTSFLSLSPCFTLCHRHLSLSRFLRSRSLSYIHQCL